VTTKDFLKHTCKTVGQPKPAKHFSLFGRKAMTFYLGKLKYEIMCVQTLQFKEIKRETGTRGRFYLLYPFNSLRQCFLAQSIPPLVRMTRYLCCKDNIHVSSLYRIIRNESRTKVTQGFEVKKLETVEEVNEEISRFELLFVCSQDFEKWILDENSINDQKGGTKSDSSS
jgi:hypothetical protein